MKVLLTQTIERTGIVGEVLDVSDGFARNYLIPKGLAIQPTKGNIERLEVARKDYEAKIKQQREQKEKLIATLQGVEVTLIRNANEEGHLFGSVSRRDIAEELQKAGHAAKGAPRGRPQRRQAGGAVPPHRHVHGARAARCRPQGRRQSLDRPRE